MGKDLDEMGGQRKVVRVFLDGAYVALGKGDILSRATGLRALRNFRGVCRLARVCRIGPAQVFDFE